MYGIEGTDLKKIAHLVCDCLGHGLNNKAVEMILETAMAETGAGTVPDLSTFAGMGLTQFDKMPFYDIKDRTNASDRKAIMECFDIDIKLVEWEHLRYSPILALIFTRLKYKKIPESIPLTTDDRAMYWKQHYNTWMGKGTPDHYKKAVVMYEVQEERRNA